MVKKTGDLSSDTESDSGDAVSVISESFHNTEGGNQVRDRNYICGYLLKKNVDGAWQKRFFESNGPFLTYYKSKKRYKLLAALNINDVFRIEMVGSITDDLGNGVVFVLKLADKGEKKHREYILRARNVAEAEKWVEKLRAIKDCAVGNTIFEEDEHAETEHMDVSLIVTSSSSPPEENEMQPREIKRNCACCVIS